MTPQTTHVGTTNPVRSDLPLSPAVPGTSGRSPRGWAAAGIGAGLAAIGTIVSSSMISGVYDESLFGDPEGIQDKLADQVPQMLVFHVTTVVSAVLLLVFAAGLLHRLRAGVGEGVLATLASSGLVGTAVVAVLGSGLDTEFIFGIPEDDMVQPANAALFNHWVGTIPWCWVLAGVSALAVYAASRRGGVPRWIGRVSLVLGGLTLIAGISPAQYMAGAFGPLWVLVVAIGFTVGDRAHRAAA